MSEVNTKPAVEIEDTAAETEKKPCFIKRIFARDKLKITIPVIVAVVVVIAVIIGVAAWNSPASVATRFAKAAFYEDYATCMKLCAFDAEKQELGKMDREEYFEQLSDRINEDVYSWKDISRYSRDMIEEELFSEFGKYSLEVRAARVKNMSTKRLLSEVGQTVWMYEQNGVFDSDLIKDVKEVTVKFKIEGEDEIERDNMTVYLVKTGALWEVLDYD